MQTQSPSKRPAEKPCGFNPRLEHNSLTHDECVRLFLFYDSQLPIHSSEPLVLRVQPSQGAWRCDPDYARKVTTGQ